MLTKYQFFCGPFYHWLREIVHWVARRMHAANEPPYTVSWSRLHYICYIIGLIFYVMSGKTSMLYVYILFTPPGRSLEAATWSWLWLKMICTFLTLQFRHRRTGLKTLKTRDQAKCQVNRKLEAKAVCIAKQVIAGHHVRYHRPDSGLKCLQLSFSARV